MNNLPKNTCQTFSGAYLTPGGTRDTASCKSPVDDDAVNRRESSATSAPIMGCQHIPTTPKMSMKIYAHRGASHSAPENTLASIRESFRANADGVEFDLQMTSDGIVILLHDETMERITKPWSESLASHPHLGALSPDAYETLRVTPVNQLNFDQIRHLDIGSWKGSPWAGETLCTFREALDIIMAAPDKGCFPEIKGGDFAIVAALQTIVLDAGVSPAQVTFIGYDEATMIQAKNLMPSFKSLHVVECESVESALALVESTAKKGKLDGIDLQADASIVTSKVCTNAHAAGLEVAVWVTSRLPLCDTAGSWDKLRHNGIDTFTSDLPPEITDWNYYPKV